MPMRAGIPYRIGNIPNHPVGGAYFHSKIIGLFITFFARKGCRVCLIRQTRLIVFGVRQKLELVS